MKTWKMHLFFSDDFVCFCSFLCVCETSQIEFSTTQSVLSVTVWESSGLHEKRLQDLIRCRIIILIIEMHNH